MLPFSVLPQHTYLLNSIHNIDTVSSLIQENLEATGSAPFTLNAILWENFPDTDKYSTPWITKLALEPTQAASVRNFFASIQKQEDMETFKLQARTLIYQMFQPHSDTIIATHQNITDKELKTYICAYPKTPEEIIVYAFQIKLLIGLCLLSTLHECKQDALTLSYVKWKGYFLHYSFESPYVSYLAEWHNYLLTENMPVPRPAQYYSLTGDFRPIPLITTKDCFAFNSKSQLTFPLTSEAYLSAISSLYASLLDHLNVTDKDKTPLKYSIVPFITTNTESDQAFVELVYIEHLLVEHILFHLSRTSSQNWRSLYLALKSGIAMHCTQGHHRIAELTRHSPTELKHIDKQNNTLIGLALGFKFFQSLLVTSCSKISEAVKLLPSILEGKLIPSELKVIKSITQLQDQPNSLTLTNCTALSHAIDQYKNDEKYITLDNFPETFAAPSFCSAIELGILDSFPATAIPLAVCSTINEPPTKKKKSTHIPPPPLINKPLATFPSFPAHGATVKNFNPDALLEETAIATVKDGTTAVSTEGELSHYIASLTSTLNNEQKLEYENTYSGKEIMHFNTDVLLNASSTYTPTLNDYVLNNHSHLDINDYP